MAPAGKAAKSPVVGYFELNVAGGAYVATLFVAM
jgi:hypothetical protein